MPDASLDVVVLCSVVEHIGLAVGAAMHAYHKYNPDAKIGTIEDLYLGPEFSNEEVETVLSHCGLRYRRIDDMASLVGGLLAEGKIVAWFQGRMESGPRALGARSILMSPCRMDSKDIINARVKYREPFRPFCPSMLFEDYQDILVNSRPEYFMITSFDSKDDMSSRIPSVIHVDGTARPQMVRREANPLYWETINQFKKHSGIGVLLNTSFNIQGEPIVCDPYQAIRCFFATGIDCLAIKNFLVEK